MLTEPGHSCSIVRKVVLDCNYRHYLWKLILDVLENEYTPLFLSSTFTHHHVESLTLSWWRSISYRNQSVDLQRKLMDWFLYDIALGHERVKRLYDKLPPFYVLLSISLYAKHTKNWVLFFRIMKPGKVLEPRGFRFFFPNCFIGKE